MAERRSDVAAVFDEARVLLGEPALGEQLRLGASLTADEAIDAARALVAASSGVRPLAAAPER